MDRRDFLKSVAVAGVAASTGGAVAFPGRAIAAQKVDLGQVKSVKVDVLSETSWFNNDIMKKNMMDYGGAMTNRTPSRGTGTTPGVQRVDNSYHS